jgi:hypothetical protein
VAGATAPCHGHGPRLHGVTSRSLTSSNKHIHQQVSPWAPSGSLVPSAVAAACRSTCLLASSVCAAGRPAMWPGRQGALRPAGRKDVWLCLLRFAPLLPVQTSSERLCFSSITWRAAGRLKGKSYGLPAKFSVQTVAISASACSRKVAVSRANCPSGQSSVEWINIQIELRKS